MKIKHYKEVFDADFFFLMLTFKVLLVCQF